MPVGLLELYLRGLTAGFALLLTIVAAVSYRRSPNRRLFFVAAALGLFSVSGGLMVYAGLDTGLGTDTLLFALTALNVGILLMLYLSMTQRVVTHR